MRQFIKLALSERGEPSIKRLVLVWVLFLFSAELVVNAVGKQRVLEATLQSQLFELLCIMVGAVVGVNIYNGWKDIKLSQTPSGPPATDPSKPNP